jgi:hypothetical protein
LAVKVTVGGGCVTVTVAEAVPLPPVPEQLSAKAVVAFRAPVDWLPLVALAPVQPPDAVQLVAFVVLQVSVELSPLPIDNGAAVSVTVAAGTEPTETVRD